MVGFCEVTAYSRLQWLNLEMDEKVLNDIILDKRSFLFFFFYQSS